MRFLKEYTEAPRGHRRFRIYTDCYGSSLAFLETLLDELQKSFPKVSAEDVEVVKYGGERIRHIYGLEFDDGPQDGEVPSDWTKVSMFDLLIA